MRFKFCVFVIFAKTAKVYSQKAIFIVNTVGTIMALLLSGSVSDPNSTLPRTVKAQVITSANLGNSTTIA